MVHDTLVSRSYGINGRPLAPDHGYPIRSIIPGFVGGRQVKWLKKVRLFSPHI
jgi:nitrate reductase (NAD(P)H)